MRLYSAVVLLCGMLAAREASAQVRINFIQINGLDPLAIAPPVGATQTTSLGVQVRDLPTERQTRLVVRCLRDTNSDGLFQSSEISVFVQLSSAELRSSARSLNANTLIVVLPTQSPQGAPDELDAEIIDSDGRELAPPATLTLHRAGKATASFFGELENVSSRTFGRLLHIFDVLRSESSERELVYTLDLPSEANPKALQAVRSEPAAIRSLALSPSGETLVWIESNDAGSRVVKGDLKTHLVARVFEVPAQLRGVQFVDEHRIVVAGLHELLLRDLNSTRQSSLSIAEATLSRLYFVRPTTDGFQAAVELSEGGSSRPSQWLVRTSGSSVTGLDRMRAHELYPALPNVNSANDLFVAERVSARVWLKRIQLPAGTEDNVAQCRSLTHIAVAADVAGHVAFSGMDCRLP